MNWFKWDGLKWVALVKVCQGKGKGYKEDSTPPLAVASLSLPNEPPSSKNMIPTCRQGTGVQPWRSSRLPSASPFQNPFLPCLRPSWVEIDWERVLQRTNSNCRLRRPCVYTERRFACCSYRPDTKPGTRSSSSSAPLSYPSSSSSCSCSSPCSSLVLTLPGFLPLLLSSCRYLPAEASMNRHGGKYSATSLTPGGCRHPLISLYVSVFFPNLSCCLRKPTFFDVCNA